MNARGQRRRVYLKLMASLSALLLLAPASSGQQPRSSTQEPVIRQHTTLVTVNVTVMDQFNRQITGLDRDRFEVYEDKVRQKIDFFSDEDTPLSIGIIFDLSGSMKHKLSRAREALKAFIETSHDEDDFFLVGFNQRASLLSGFSGGETIINKLTLVDPNGQTALFDAACLGVEKAREGRHDKRALLVISDGQDNSSRYSYGELSRLLKESDVQIYCIGIGEEGAAAGSVLDRQGQTILEEIAHTTGGLAFFPHSWEELEDAVTRIALVLRHQYSLGYVPLNDKRDGKWRKIKVRINPPKGLPSLIVRAREGYYATP
ncbi:MAG TPA: VWA domain-containing protein [Blastocatellia bacterium]|nr:VWA domain-containing protein [Blastocatellia bacterium]